MEPCSDLGTEEEVVGQVLKEEWEFVSRLMLGRAPQAEGTTKRQETVLQFDKQKVVWSGLYRRCKGEAIDHKDW